MTVDDSGLGDGVSITKVEAKIGEDGSWTDITSNRTISISQNVTVYIRATDSSVILMNRTARSGVMTMKNRH